MIEIKNLKGEILRTIDAPSLRGAYLQYADLRGANLQYASLEGADLRGANLECANLEGADLRGANIQDASLQDANLRGANLQDARLQDASLQYASLQGARLQGANLRGANLQYARLQYASLQYARLQYASLQYAILPTGETWEAYCAEVVPALLAAGGRAVTPEAWQCHDWSNCLIACAFGVQGLNQVPSLYQPRAEQLIQFFDAGLLDHLAPKAAE